MDARRDLPRGIGDERRHGRRRHCRGCRALIDAAQSFHESLKHASQPTDDLGEVMQQAPTVELSNILSYSLNAKYALAFGIDLQRQLAAVQLEDCQIIRRSLDRDFPFGRPHVAWAVFWPALVSKDRLLSSSGPTALGCDRSGPGR